MRWPTTTICSPCASVVDLDCLKIFHLNQRKYHVHLVFNYSISAQAQVERLPVRTNTSVDCILEEKNVRLISNYGAEYTADPWLSGPLITVFQVPWLLGFFTNNSSQYHDPDNQGIGFFYYYQELFLDLVIPIIKDLLYFIRKTTLLQF